MVSAILGSIVPELEQGIMHNRFQVCIYETRNFSQRKAQKHTSKKSTFHKNREDGHLASWG